MPRKKSRPHAALEVVCNIGRAIAAEMDMAGLLELIYQESVQVLESECFAVGVYDPAEQSLRFDLLYNRGEQQPALLLRKAEGWGLAGRVFDECTSLLFDDLAKSELVEEALPLGETPLSWLGVRLVAREQPLGVIVLQDSKAKAFQPDDQQLLEAIAGQAAVALGDLLLHQEHERRIAELSVLTEINRALSSALEFEELLDVIYQQVNRVFDARSFFIATYEEGATDWASTLHLEDGERQESVRHTIAAGLTGHIIRNREPLLFRSTDELMAFHEAHEIPVIGEQARCWMGVPLIAAGGVVGVMAIQSYEEPALYGEQELALFSAIATQIAIAIRNARHYAEARQRAEEMATLCTVSRIVGESLEAEETWRAIFEAVQRVAPYSGIEACLYDERKGIMRSVMTGTMERVGPPEKARVFRPGEGFAGKIAQTRQPLVVADILEAGETQFKFEPLAETELRSYLGVPMMLGDRLYGTLAVVHTDPRVYRGHHVDLLLGVAVQGAASIEQARLFEETRSRAERLALVNRIANAAGAALQTDDLMETVYEQVHPIFQPDAFFLALYDEDSDELDIRFLVDEGVRQPVARWPLGKGLTSVVVGEKRPLIVSEEEEYQRLQISPEWFGTKPPASWLGAPMMAGERVLGIISVQSYRPHAWDEQDELLLTTIADQVSVGLENVRLLEEARTRADELAVLNTLGRALTGRLSVEQVLNEAFQGTARLLDATNFYVALYDADRNEVTFAFDVTEGEISMPQTTRQAGQGLTEYVIRNREPVLLRSGEEVDSFHASQGVEAVGRAALSWLGVPLIVGDQVVGVMAVQSYTTPNVYGERDRDLMGMLADHVAVALDNARLNEAVELELAERRQTQEALAESEKRFRSIAETATDAMIIFDSRENVFFWNRAAQEIFGYGVGETQDRFLSSILNKDFCETFRNEMEQVASTGESDLIGRTVEATGLRKDGAEFPLELSVATWKAKEELFFTVIARDITYRKEAEAALLQSEQDFQRIAHTIEDVLYIVDGETGEFTYLSPAFEKMLGYTPADIQQMGGRKAFLSQVVQEPESAEPERPFGELILEGEVDTPDWRAWQHKDGSLVYIEDRPIPIYDGDRLVSTQGVLRDVTERKRAEDALQQALQDVRQASARQRQLLDTVRQLSTPLVPITDEVLVLPLVGAIDSQRAQQILDVLLEGVTNRRARAVILDITGVPIVDTSVANHLLLATQALRLVGAECILVGITPEVAQTVVGLGVELAGLVTRSDLQGGVEYALSRVGKRVREA